MSTETPRQAWGRVAAGWSTRADQMRDFTMPVSLWLVEALDLQPGHTILELGAGPGDTGFLAAELIRPGGTLITSDFAPEMLTVAQERAAAAGLDNVRFKQVDAHSIDLEAASVDGVLGRWVYMLAEDPGAALRETRRILKPGGRVALAAWAPAEENPWMSIPGRAIVAHGLAERPPEDAPGPMRWAQEGRIADELQDAGFVEFEVAAVDFEFAFPSLDAWWSWTLDTSRRTSDAVEAASPDAVDRLRAAIRDAAAPHAAAGGSVRLPARTWVAHATA